MPPCAVPPLDPWATLEAQAAAWGIALDARQLDQFRAYWRLLVEANRRTNLTRITEERDVVIKHFLDSLSVLYALAPAGPEPMRIGDIGAGAGFPGIPMLIARPRDSLTLLEASAKKVAFLDALLAELGLSATVIHGRAEDLGRSPSHRERYDVVTARAVAELAVLAEFCLPLVRVGGRFVAPKGAKAPAELAAAGKALRVLGAAPPKIVSLQLPGDAGGRQILVIPKMAETPIRYPRTAGTPQRSKIC